MYRDVLQERRGNHLYEAVKSRIEADNEAINRFLSQIAPYCRHANFDKIAKRNAPPGEPCLENTWFAGGDARAAYGITAAMAPRKIIEIGSGNSTMFIKRAIRDFGLSTHLTSIDPAPRAEIDQLCDNVVRQSLVQVDVDVFRSLEAGDILFHDGSHLTFNGTDTVKLFLEVLPVVAPGVIIHIHDIFLPYEYSDSFDHRGYSEQYMLAAALLFSKQFEVVLPLAHLSRHRRFEPGVSFWIRKLP